MSRPVRTTPQADLHILETDHWWRRHRDLAPELFEQELALAFKTLAAAPLIGKQVPHPDVEGLRRVLLRATRTHVYYVARDDHVLVVAVWSAVRGAGPDLSDLGGGAT